MKLTDEQAEITEAVPGLKGGDILKVIAFAGAGKTTTLKSCAMARRDKGLYLAFNKSIAAEAKEKLARTRCKSMTMHGLAFSAMRDFMGAPVDITAKMIIDAGVMGDFHIPQIRGWGAFRVASAVSRTMAQFAASADSEFLPQHADAALIEALGDPDFIAIEEKAALVRDTMDKLSEPIRLIAEKFWGDCMDEGQYSHDMYLKMMDLDDGVRAEAFRRYKYVMIDEAQDINPVQRSILTKVGIPIIAVGDPYQQIYSWRGAENALARLPGKELYLTQSFRFGDPIAVIARRVLSSIPGGGPEKKLVGAGPGDMKGYDGPKGAVLCRTNIGMLDEAIKYINKGYRVHVDNISGLVTDALSAQALYKGERDKIVTPEIKQFSTWEEMQQTAEEGGDPNLSKLVQLVRTHRIPDVVKLSEKHDPNPKDVPLVVYTGHRSKGLEFPAVQLGDDWPDLDTMRARYKGAETKSEKHLTLAKESFNLLYVGVTRAMLRCQGFTRILEPKVEDIPYDADVERDYTPA